MLFFSERVHRFDWRVLLRRRRVPHQLPPRPPGEAAGQHDQDGHVGARGGGQLHPDADGDRGPDRGEAAEQDAQDHNDAGERTRNIEQSTVVTVLGDG